MTKQIKLFIVSADGSSIQADSRAREIQLSDVDTMRKNAKKILERDSLKIRSINYDVNGNLIVYAYKIGSEPAPVEQVKGWVFKRGNLPTKT